MPWFEIYEAAPGKPSGKHAHIVGPCNCPEWTEPAPRSLAIDMLAAVLTLIARRTR